MKNNSRAKILAVGTAFAISAAVGFGVMSNTFGSGTVQTAGQADSQVTEQMTAQADSQAAGQAIEEEVGQTTLQETEEEVGQTTPQETEEEAGQTTPQETESETAQEASQADEGANVTDASLVASEDGNTALASLNMVTGGAIDTADLFTNRDLEQTVDLSEAKTYTVSDGQTGEITSAGVYLITGSASNAQILVNAGDEDKVQIVLDGVSITNDSTPCIYVKSADKVFITTTNSENNLSVTGSFTADGDVNTDAVVFCKDDVVFNGTGTLTIQSTDNGITGKDDIKVTGGTINITCAADALEANDSIRIAGGQIQIATNKDGLHAENDDDDSVGYIYICGGTLKVQAGDDAIHATTILQIDGGELELSAGEGLEATWIQINDGNVRIEASDDGINAAYKSAKIAPTAEFNGGTVTIVMGAGDTDAVDSNGNLIITGGTLDISAQSPFDYDGTCQKTGGTLIVNGTETDTITNQMMGGGKGGGMKGGKGGHGGGMW